MTGHLKTWHRNDNTKNSFPAICVLLDAFMYFNVSLTYLCMIVGMQLTAMIYWKNNLGLIC